MKKILNFALAITMCCSVLVGCNSKSNENDSEDTSAATTEDTSDETSAEDSDSAESDEVEDTQDSVINNFKEEVKDTFIDENPNLNMLVDYFNNDVYFNTDFYIYSEETGELAYNSVLAKKGEDNFYIYSNLNDMDVIMIAKGEDCYVVLPNNSMYQKGTKEELGVEAALSSFELFDIFEYTESANVIVDGEELVREEYNVMGSSLFYYFNSDNIPVYNYSEANGAKSLNIIKELSTQVDDSLFEIPEDCTEITE